MNDIHCGQSRWAATKNRSLPLPSKRGQDQTGLVVATCLVATYSSQYSVVLGGVNMYHGERFGYAHYLHQLMFVDVAFFASDICCKYWPWVQRVSESFPELDTGSNRPYLSAMHAFAHSYHCQAQRLYDKLFQLRPGGPQQAFSTDWTVLCFPHSAHCGRIGSSSTAWVKI